MNKDRSVTIQPVWPLVGLMIVGSIVLSYGILNGLTVSAPFVVSSYACIVYAVCGTWKSFRSHTFDSRGITVKLFCFLTIRSVTWDEVIRVYLFQQCNSARSQTRVVALLGGGRPFDPAMDNLRSFQKKNRKFTISIDIPDAKAKQYSESLIGIYPELEVVNRDRKDPLT